MTHLFLSMLALHVVVAVLGLGSIVSVAVVAAALRRMRGGSPDAPVLLAPLLRISAICLGLLLVTGILLDVAAGGAFHDRWWFRGSALLLVLTGAMHGRARHMVGHALGSDARRDAALRGIERLAYGMSAAIVGITVLMETRPF